MLEDHRSRIPLQAKRVSSRVVRRISTKQKKIIDMDKAEFIEKWKLQSAVGYGRAQFDFSESLEKDLDSVIQHDAQEMFNKAIKFRNEHGADFITTVRIAAGFNPPKTQEG